MDILKTARVVTHKDPEYAVLKELVDGFRTKAAELGCDEAFEMCALSMTLALIFVDATDDEWFQIGTSFLYAAHVNRDMVKQSIKKGLN